MTRSRTIKQGRALAFGRYRRRNRELFLGGKPAPPAPDIRFWQCPNCGSLRDADVRQAERDECCVYVCRRCDSIVEEDTPF
jgi:hypothetical protein